MGVSAGARPIERKPGEAHESRPIRAGGSRGDHHHRSPLGARLRRPADGVRPRRGAPAHRIASERRNLTPVPSRIRAHDAGCRCPKPSNATREQNPSPLRVRGRAGEVNTAPGPARPAPGSPLTSSSAVLQEPGPEPWRTGVVREAPLLLAPVPGPGRVIVETRLTFRGPPPTSPAVSSRAPGKLGTRSESSPARRPVRDSAALLVAQGLDRVHPGGSTRRVDPEDDADEDRDAEGGGHRPGRDDRLEPVDRRRQR